MKLKKTLIATLSLSVLIAPTLTGAESNQVTKADSAPPIKTFDDIQGHWGQHNIEYLIDVGSINGFPDGTFRPDEPITRASAVKMIVSELGLPLDNSDSVFPDVTDKFWAKPYINTGKTEAIIKGYPNGNFGPKDLLTRGELASILVRAYNINLRDKDKALRFPDVKYKYWAYDDINALDQFGAVKGATNGKFNPLKNISRAEFSAFLERVVNPESPDREEPSSNIDNIAKIDFAFEKSLKVGDSHILKLIIEYKDGTKKDVTKDTRFLIEDSSVAIIKNGNIKGLTQGETKLTAEYEGIKAITSIVVKTIVIEEPINPNDPILVDGNLNINPISIKGFVFTHNTNWWRDDNSENPKYILNNGKFVKPTWLDEANNTHIDMPVPNEEKSFVGNYEINNEKDLFTMAYHVVFYRGADLTKDEIYNAVKKVQSTKNSVKLNKYTFSIKQFEGSPEFVNITNY